MKFYNNIKSFYVKASKSDFIDALLIFTKGGNFALYVAMTIILSHVAYIESIGIKHIYNVLILWVLIFAISCFVNLLFRLARIKLIEPVFLIVIFTIILQYIMDYATPINDNYLYLMVVSFLVSVFLLGGFILFIIKGKMNKVLNVFCILVFLAFPLFVLVFTVSPGKENEKLNKYLNYYEKQEFNEMDKKYENESFFYGSGKDRYRKWYGNNVDYITKPMDASRFLTSETDKIFDISMDFLFKIDKENIPLNGIAYYPIKKEKSKIVVFTHGMHDMYDYSEFGYEYLLDSLSRQGYIAISIDENFLNSSPLGSYKDEEDMRALLILEHISLLEKMNDDPKSDLYEKVNFEDITIVGHSRGGEAVYTAAYLNSQDYLEEADFEINYHHDILNVIALAPTDKRYLPDGKVPVLKNTNYFAIHGANDADVDKYYAYNAYSRNIYDDDEFYINLGIYFYGGNHGQFNTVWGNKDSSAPLKNALLMTKNLMPQKAQRDLLEKTMSIFLDITVNKEYEKTKYFSDFNQNFKKYLYNTRYLVTYDTSNLIDICDFESIYNFENTNKVYIDETYSKEEKKRYNKALYIDSENQISTTIENDPFILPDNGKLYVDIASMYLEDIQEININLIDGNGSKVKSQKIEILPVIPVEMIKWPLFERLKYEDKYEYCFETIEILRSEFSQNENFDYSNIVKVEIENVKKIMIDNIRIKK